MNIISKNLFHSQKNKNVELFIYINYSLVNIILYGDFNLKIHDIWRLFCNWYLWKCISDFYNGGKLNVTSGFIRAGASKNRHACAGRVRECV